LFSWLKSNLFPETLACTEQPLCDSLALHQASATRLKTVLLRCRCTTKGFIGKSANAPQQHGMSLMSFMDYDVGYFDLETQTLEPLENPFGSKAIPM
jgi:hypothetical protein